MIIKESLGLILYLAFNVSSHWPKSIIDILLLLLERFFNNSNSFFWVVIWKIVFSSPLKILFSSFFELYIESIFSMIKLYKCVLLSK